MRLKWRKQKEALAVPVVQIRNGSHHPFGMLGDYVPLRNGEVRLYRAVREAVPVVDAAIYKLIRMSGGVTVSCGSRRAEAALAEFLRTVPVGRGQFGINAFLDCYLDSLLTCGQAVGEIVPAAGNREIAALLCGRVEDIEVREGENPLTFSIWGPDEGGRMAELPYQDLLLFTPLNPEADSPYGVSLLRSLPFLADILMKIYHATGVNWERCGNVRFAVTCRNGDGTGAAEKHSTSTMAVMGTTDARASRTFSPSTVLFSPSRSRSRSRFFRSKRIYRPASPAQRVYNVRLLQRSPLICLHIRGLRTT